MRSEELEIFTTNHTNTTNLYYEILRLFVLVRVVRGRFFFISGKEK